jgi:hypothetical protein
VKVTRKPDGKYEVQQNQIVTEQEEYDYKDKEASCSSRCQSLTRCFKCKMQKIHAQRGSSYGRCTKLHIKVEPFTLESMFWMQMKESQFHRGLDKVYQCPRQGQ